MADEQSGRGAGKSISAEDFFGLTKDCGLREPPQSRGRRRAAQGSSWPVGLLQNRVAGPVEAGRLGGVAGGLLSQSVVHLTSSNKERLSGR